MNLTQRMKGIGVPLALVLASACATAGPRAAATTVVQRGDSRDRVIELLAVPGDRQFSGDDEALQYCKTTGLLSPSGEYTVVWLFRNRVTGVTTYRETLEDFRKCGSAFRTIRWEEAPTRPPLPEGVGVPE